MGTVVTRRIPRQILLEEIRMQAPPARLFNLFTSPRSAAELFGAAAFEYTHGNPARDNRCEALASYNTSDMEKFLPFIPSTTEKAIPSPLRILLGRGPYYVISHAHMGVFFQQTHINFEPAQQGGTLVTHETTYELRPGMQQHAGAVRCMFNAAKDHTLLTLARLSGDRQALNTLQKYRPE